MDDAEWFEFLVKGELEAGSLKLCNNDARIQERITIKDVEMDYEPVETETVQKIIIDDSVVHDFSMMREISALQDVPVNLLSMLNISFIGGICDGKVTSIQLKM
jgi:hypothetical protein